MNDDFDGFESIGVTYMDYEKIKWISANIHIIADISDPMDKLERLQVAWEEHKMSLSEPIIVCAAIQLQDGLIIASPRHYDRTCHKILDVIKDARSIGSWEQGFIDQHGRFYNRKDAFQIAVKNNQIRRPSQYETDLLYSENLY